MPFDLSTAKPMVGGFDLGTAKPVGGSIDEQYAEEARRNLAAGQEARGQAAYKEGQGVGRDMAMFLPNAAAGAVRGAGSIGSTLIAPWDMAADGLDGKGLSLASNRERRAKIDQGLQAAGADPTSLGYRGGKLGGEIAGTAGLGPALAIPLRAAGVSPTLAQAIATSGMRTGAAPATGMGRLADLGLRMGGGAAVGGASAGLVNPDDMDKGAMIGGALPLAMLGAGKIGSMVGRTVSGPRVAQDLQGQIAAARAAGYVIPPTQAKPSLINRALEGFSGKLTTAQNASARNQGVTNELAKKAIGTSELSPAGLQQVRQQANAAYDALGQAGAFQADPAFAAALDRAGSSTAALRQNFPELVNSNVDEMIAGLKSRPQFEAQPTIEAIKQFRANAAVMKRSDDPAKLAMGKAQSQIAGALEDLIDRNLQQSGNSALLDGYRAARQVLAKTYDVEKALNATTGNVDAGKLAQILKKGRPLTGELRAIAEFAAAFPKAAQRLEGMGSLPGTSPLDWHAAGATSLATANPLMMAGVAARPAARALALSNVVQNRLMPGSPGYIERLLQDQRTQQLMYQGAPVLGTN